MRSSIEENIIEVKRRVEEAAKKAGRNTEDVLILAVSKTIDVPRIKEDVQCGVNTIGEKRVQVIMDKDELLGEVINWNLKGYFKTTKEKNIS